MVPFCGFTIIVILSNIVKISWNIVMMLFLLSHRPNGNYDTNMNLTMKVVYLFPSSFTHNARVLCNIYVLNMYLYNIILTVYLDV